VSELDSYLDFAKGLAKEAGGIMLHYFRANDIGTKWKEDDTPITIADIKINKLVIEAVSQAYPEHGVHGEEESLHEGREFMWVCDPVDGTMPFSAGIPISTFSLALTKNGKPILGVVYDPFGDRLFSSAANLGAYLNGSKIHVSHNSSLKNSFVNMEVWGAERATNDSKIIPIDGLRDRLMEMNIMPFTLCSMVISGVLVAEGAFIGGIFGVRKPEDIAALKVIVEEAGGKVTDLDGNEQRYDRLINGAIVSNGLVHKELIKAVSGR
jgi:fructose-1,6-bisphosphatase/inositol monophosphatase family enzyme